MSPIINQSNSNFMDPLAYLGQVRDTLRTQAVRASDVEFTYGNYTDDGKLIEAGVPTLTTELAEIGAIGATAYLVVIIASRSFNKQAFNTMKSWHNLQIYGFRECCTNLYPSPDFRESVFFDTIISESWVQLQFNYSIPATTPEQFVVEHQKIWRVLGAFAVVVVNQLRTKM